MPVIRPRLNKLSVHYRSMNQLFSFNRLLFVRSHFSGKVIVADFFDPVNTCRSVRIENKAKDLCNEIIVLFTFS